MTWISNLDGLTRGRHMSVPADLKAEAEKAAKKSLEGDDDDDDEDGDGDGNGEGDKMEL